MGNSQTTTLKLVFLAQSGLACLYRNSAGKQKWIPSSVCPRTFKHGNNVGDIHEVTIEDWWLEQNPWENKESTGQTFLL